LPLLRAALIAGQNNVIADVDNTEKRPLAFNANGPCMGWKPWFVRSKARNFSHSACGQSRSTFPDAAGKSSAKAEKVIPTPLSKLGKPAICDQRTIPLHSFTLSIDFIASSQEPKALSLTTVMPG
jgi:hypothetical protein